MEAERTAVQRQRAQETLKPKLAVEKTFSEQAATSSCHRRLAETRRDLQNAEGLEGSGCKRAAKKRITHSKVGGEKAVHGRCGQG